LALMTVVARIPVRFSFDDDTRDWHFVVDQQGWGVVGGGQTTLSEARQAAAEAVVVALEAHEPLDADGGQVEYLDVAVG
jgi:hypothetical protein